MIKECTTLDRMTSYAEPEWALRLCGNEQMERPAGKALHRRSQHSKAATGRSGQVSCAGDLLAEDQNLQ